MLVRTGLGGSSGVTTAPTVAVMAPAAPCPAGYGVPSFQDGLKHSLSSLPVSLLMGPLYAFSSWGSDSPGNVLAPGAAAAQQETACFQATRETNAQRIGLALPGLLVVGAIGWFLFGRGR